MRYIAIRVCIHRVGALFCGSATLDLVFSKIGAQHADSREIYIDEFLVNLVMLRIAKRLMSRINWNTVM
jgi:hypothetical protein